MTDERDPDAGETFREADDGRDPLVVFRCSGDTEADVVKSLLESCGIPAI